MYKKIKELADKKGISMYRVSKDTGIPQSTMSEWKRGMYQPKLDKLVILAGYFEVPIEYFIKE